VADPPYTKASNQQSYQQLLWKSFLLSENYLVFLVCAFALFAGQNFFQRGMMRLNSQLLQLSLEAKLVNKQFGPFHSASVLSLQVLLPTSYPTWFQTSRIQ
jgi:hypothetical protein